MATSITKFTQSDLKKINETQKLIQELQKRQDEAYSELCCSLPSMQKHEEDILFDYVFNNQSMTISLGQDGLKLEPIFTAENYDLLRK